MYSLLQYLCLTSIFISEYIEMNESCQLQKIFSIFLVIFLQLNNTFFKQERILFFVLENIRKLTVKNQFKNCMS